MKKGNYIWEFTLSDLQLICHLFLHNVENNVSKFWSLEPEPAGAGDIGCRSVTTSVDTCDTVTERGEWQTEWQLQSWDSDSVWQTGTDRVPDNIQLFYT